MSPIPEDELIEIINHLRSYAQEQAWFEFKENRCEPNQLGRDLSAVHNGAFIEFIAPVLVSGMRCNDINKINAFSTNFAHDS